MQDELQDGVQDGVQAEVHENRRPADALESARDRSSRQARSRTLCR